MLLHPPPYLMATTLKKHMYYQQIHLHKEIYFLPQLKLCMTPASLSALCLRTCDHRRLQTYPLEGASGCERQKYGANWRIRGVWGHAPWEIVFLDDAKCCKLGLFIIFVRPLGGGHGPLLGAAYALANTRILLIH